MKSLHIVNSRWHLLVLVLVLVGISISPVYAKTFVHEYTLSENGKQASEQSAVSADTPSLSPEQMKLIEQGKQAVIRMYKKEAAGGNDERPKALVFVSVDSNSDIAVAERLQEEMIRAGMEYSFFLVYRDVDQLRSFAAARSESSGGREAGVHWALVTPEQAMKDFGVSSIPTSLIKAGGQMTAMRNWDAVVVNMKRFR